MTASTDPLAAVAAVADAVLFEGYLLYPYRASAQKNRLRWQFGVLTPAGDGTEPTRNRTECLLEPPTAGAAAAAGAAALPAAAGALPVHIAGEPVPELIVDGVSHLAFEEGVPRQLDTLLALDDLVAGETVVPIELPATREVEPVHDASGAVVGQLLRECWPVTGRIVVSATDLPGPYLVYRLRLDVINDGDCAPGAPREEVLRTLADRRAHAARRPPPGRSCR